MTKKTPTESSVWEVFTYDVWGNAKDGYDVNDRYCHEREYEIDLPITVYNVGQTGEFSSAYPSDKQIRAAFGIACKFDCDGDDLTIYVKRSRDWYPIGELHCTSHDSLSPIRRKVSE